VRVISVGGGPAGLYAAILLRRADPDIAVTVYERNAPEDTFGFGVVFSAATLTQLADADPVSHARILREAARWDPVEIRYRGARHRAHAHRGAAGARHRLLAILQQRAIDLGADVRFGSQIDDPARLDTGADLVLGADGVNSAVRRTFADAFRPRLTVEGSTYIWLATTRPFDAFTFIFTETDHGLFQAHVYPFSETTSTFIVETSRDTWRTAGLDTIDASALAPGRSDAHSIAYLSELFADDLDGRELLGNNSRWLDWTTVRTATWSHDRVVLLGDAAHTAHFSIGSGTKLALEDAIALAGAVERCDDLHTALAEYEAERRPAVERVQQAAAESLDWFARYRRYWGLPAPQFAYSLLTRSDRIDYDNIRRRDPGLLLGVERWFAEEVRGGAHDTALTVPPPPALTAIDVGDLRLPNRTVLTVTPDQCGGDDGMPTDDLVAGYRRAALGGAGAVVLDHVAVSAHARISPGDPGLWSDAHARRWADVTALLHTETDAALGVQLLHAGARGATRPRDAGVDLPLRAGAWPLVAASAVPYTPVSAVPHPLDARRRAEITEDFANAARLAAAAGFDLLEVHAGHGYLLAGFLSPLTNDRDDELGGDVAARLVFPLEVVDAVRAAWPADRPLSVCVSASDLQRGGLAEDDAVEIAGALVAHGVDVLRVVAGQTTAHASPDYGAVYDARWSDLLRNRAGAPTIASGGVATVSQANHVLAAGMADLVIVGRPAPIEPPWLAEMRATRGDAGRT
jgi:anthraniloyl-CoA monooxygenase